MFLPSLRPDHFAGFPGFYLSAKEAIYELPEAMRPNKIVIVGPQGLTEAIRKGACFLGRYHKNMECLELP